MDLGAPELLRERMVCSYLFREYPEIYNGDAEAVGRVDAEACHASDVLRAGEPSEGCEYLVFVHGGSYVLLFQDHSGFHVPQVQVKLGEG